jgi:hypothetical protein
MPRGVKNVPSSHKSGIQDSTTITVTRDNEERSSKVKVETKEQESRTEPVPVEKAKPAEKDVAPTIILSWYDGAGKRLTRTYTCAEISINENKRESIKSGPKKTFIDLTIDAQVIDMDTR